MAGFIQPQFSPFTKVFSPARDTRIRKPAPSRNWEISSELIDESLFLLPFAYRKLSRQMESIMTRDLLK
jgi:hypothetical protein